MCSEEEERKFQVLGEYRAGFSLSEIGKKLNLSRERVRQIIVMAVAKEMGISPSERKNPVQSEMISSEIKAIKNNNKVFRRKRVEDRCAERWESCIRKKILPESFSTIRAFIKASGITATEIGKYHPEVILFYRRRVKKWSKHYNFCRACKTISVPHRSFGLCEKCYVKSEHFKELGRASRLRHLDERNASMKRYFNDPAVKKRMKEKWDMKLYDGNREKALIRDGYKCQKCGMTMEESIKKSGKELRMGRLNLDSTDNRLDNLATFCTSCGFQYIRTRRREIGTS